MKYWLDIASSVSGPVLAVAALLGLWQLWLARESLDTSRKAFELSQRDIELRLASEAMRLSVDMCMRFAEHVLPLIDKADAVVEKFPLPDSLRGGDPWDPSSYDQKWYVGVFARREKVASVVKALNEIEAIALPFAQGAADETVARESIGAAFIKAAHSYAYVIAASRSQGNSNAYPATRALCTSWSERGLMPSQDDEITL